MNPEELQKNIALYYSRLPADAQKMFSSMEWVEKLKKLSIKYALNEEQSKTLASETVLVLLGIIHMMEYEENLTKDIKIPRDTLEIMLQDLRNSILRPVIMQVTEAYDNNLKETRELEASMQEEERDAKTEEGRERVESELDARFDKLPKEIKDSIIETNYYDNLYRISEKHGLNMIQIQSLEEVSTMVLTGEIKSDQFIDMIGKKVGINTDLANKIGMEINETVLKPIRVKMEVKIPREDKKQEKGPNSILNIKIDRQAPVTPATPVKIVNPTINPPVSTTTPPKIDAMELGSGLSNKFNAPAQTKVQTTDHTLQGAKVNSANKLPSIDPYREIPE